MCEPKRKRRFSRGWGKGKRTRGNLNSHHHREKARHATLRRAWILGLCGVCAIRELGLGVGDFDYFPPPPAPEPKHSQSTGQICDCSFVPPGGRNFPSGQSGRSSGPGGNRHRQVRSQVPVTLPKGIPMIHIKHEGTFSGPRFFAARRGTAGNPAHGATRGRQRRGMGWPLVG